MDTCIKNVGKTTPTKLSENANPNISQSPRLKSSKSLLTNSATKIQKSSSKNPNQILSQSPLNKIRDRKFILAKGNLKKERSNHSTVVCKCKDEASREKSRRCVCVAYENLRVSQELFFKNQTNTAEDMTVKEEDGKENRSVETQNDRQIGKKSDCNVLEDTRERDPDSGPGIVKLLVKAFEKLGTTSEDSDQICTLPEIQQQGSTFSFSKSDFLVTTESLGLDSKRSSSLDSSQGSFMESSINSSSSSRRRRKSLESTGTFGGSKWKRKQLKATCHKPFMLKTEERGRCKEEEFMKKVKQITEEEKKLRIPIAQWMPLTTDEPEMLVKPPKKERTVPVDLKLHSDIRAVERTGFDQQMKEKIDFIEQYKMERDRKQKLAEEEEIRQMRKELVPKAQPMPYFDRPFIPKRSVKQSTIPKEPKFNLQQHHAKKIKS
ncbi:protein WVD2-like 4 [Impatiens glandulifera]|uniref:protein WVD2-like 4 n=1 Tax=Impatiens glandulifera TaxID=253017 RepID=UPI001FB05E12|nr:protein WVD2-like 4 [Impatiens glandulifera]